MRQIPRVPPSGDRERTGFDESVKERLEVIAGLRGGKILPLESTATLAECIAKINEIRAVLQG